MFTCLIELLFTYSITYIEGNYELIQFIRAISIGNIYVIETYIHVYILNWNYVWWSILFIYLYKKHEWLFGQFLDGVTDRWTNYLSLTEDICNSPRQNKKKRSRHAIWTFTCETTKSRKKKEMSLSLLISISSIHKYTIHHCYSSHTLTLVRSDSLLPIFSTYLFRIYRSEIWVHWRG